MGTERSFTVDLHAVFAELQELAWRDPIGTYTRAGYPHRLKKQGKWLAGLCPFHADTQPSFRIDPNGRWRCFGACGSGGDLCDFYARLHHCPQSQAARELAALFGLAVPEEPSPTSAKQRVTRREPPSPQIVAALQNALWSNAQALRFLRQERCLSDETIKAARLGFHQGRFAIPVFTESGEVADVRLYAPDGSPKMQAWREGTGAARLYFPPDWRPVVPGDTLIISEGELDCLLLSDLGFRALTNTNGAAAWPPDVELDLRGVTVILASDNDSAGRQRNEMLARWCRQHGASAVYAVTWPQDAPAGFDVTDYAREHAPDRDRMTEAIGKLLADAAPVFAFATPDEALQAALPTEGWLADWLEYTRPFNEACNAFLLAAGLVCLAQAVGRRAWVPFGDRDLYPNVFVLLVGPQALSRKSTCLALARRMVDAALPDETLAEGFTPEALHDELANNAQRLWLVDEYAAVAEAGRRDYQAGLLQLLASLYDCGDRYRLARRTEGLSATIEKPCLNVFAATTLAWLKPALGRGDLGGGLLSRFLYFVSEGRARLLPIRPRHDQHKHNALVNGLHELRKALGQGRELDPTPVERDFAAFYRQADTWARQDVEHDGVLGGFYSRIAEAVLKLAVLYTLAADPQATAISRQALHCAIALAWWLRENARRVVGEIAETDEDYIRRRVLEILQAHKGQAVSRRDLHARLASGRRDARTFDAVLKALVKEGTVAQVAVKDPLTGKPARGEWYALAE